MKRICVKDSYGLSLEAGDRIFDSEEMFLFDISTDAPYYGYYPNEWYKSYKE